MVRRALFGLFWVGIFWVALTAIGGGLAGASAGSHTPAAEPNFRAGFGHGYQAGVVAGVEFRERYGTWLLLGAVALAAAGTFLQILPGTRRR